MHVSTRLFGPGLGPFASYSKRWEWVQKLGVAGNYHYSRAASSKAITTRALKHFGRTRPFDMVCDGKLRGRLVPCVNLFKWIQCSGQPV
jgi:hypothetical protein